MNAFLQSTILTLILVPAALGQQPAANQMPPAAVEVLERMDKEIVIAKTKAVTALDKILKDTTKKGDLQGALVVKAEIEKLHREIKSDRPAPGSGFVGRWTGQGWTAESFPDGTILFSNGVRGRWQERGGSVHIECDNGDVHDIDRTPEGYAGAYTGGPGKGMKIIYRKQAPSP